MKNIIGKIFLASTITLTAVLPVMANMTDLTLNATVQSVIALRLEATDAALGLGTVVSGDNILEPTVTETLSFGDVDPLGSSTGTAGSTSNVTHLQGSFEVYGVNTSANTLFATSSPSLGGDHGGSLYVYDDALRVTTFRTGGTDTVNVSVANNGNLDSVLIDANTNGTIASGVGDYTTGSVITVNDDLYPGDGSGNTSGALLLTNSTNATDNVIDVGLRINWGHATGNLSSVVTFTGVAGT